MNKSFVEILKSGRTAVGVAFSMPLPGAIERFGHEWDWVWIDGQHGVIGYPEILSMVRACDAVGVASIVRVPSHENGLISMTLDAGADGVMVPMVDTPDQAEAVVRAAKFPPLGDRSFGGRRVIDTRGRMYAHTSNDATFLMAQIETPEGLENVDAIAAVDGVDIIFLGPDDMRLRRGERMDEPRSMEQLERDMERVAEAGRANGKPCAMPAIGSEMIQLCQRIGFQIICCGMDAAFLADGSQAASQVARKTLAEGSPVDVKGDPESLY